jgi:tRNA (guanine6-N2)-methyltransferase
MHRPRGRASRARFPVIVRTLRGLEAVARDEVEAVLGPIPVSVEHRALRFSLPRLDRRLLALGTVDDAFLLIGEADGIGHRRGALRGLASLASTLDFQDALSAVASLRRIRRPVAFDVTASFVGPRNYSRFEIEDAVGRAIAAPTGWSYQSRSATRRPEPTSLSVRVHVLHTVATLSIRLAERPLHRRDYRVVSRPGALHPPLARALSLLADPAPGDRLVDPACGVGTIPIEAALLGRRARPMGFDLAPAAVHAARVNAARARVDVRFGIADAARLPPAAVDRVVINPPWGDAVAAAGGLRRRPSDLWTALARVLADDGRLVALVRCGTVAERDLRRAGLDAETVAWVRVSGAEAAVLAAAPAH